MAVEFQEKFLMRVATQISHISSSRRKIQHKVNKDSGLRANFIEQFIREEIHTPILSDALRLNYRPAVWVDLTDFLHCTPTLIRVDVLQMI